MCVPKGDGFDVACAKARAHCEDLWSDFRDFADSNFKREFAINTHQRWFEMYVTVSLIRAGPVKPFIDGSVEHVSAVLASRADAANLPSQLGDDFVLYPNLTCESPWPRRALCVGREWRFEESDDEWKGTLV